MQRAVCRTLAGQMQPQPGPSHAIGPYRGAPLAEKLRPDGVPVPRVLTESRLVDAVTLDLRGSMHTPKVVALHAIMAVVTLGPILGVAIALPFGGPPELLVPAVMFLVVFGWVWRMALRSNRAGALMNADRWAEAERVLGKSQLGIDLLLGICAQVRGDHATAEQCFHRSLQVFEHRPTHLQPVQAQAYARQAIALINLGKLDWAQARLSRMPVTGDYLAALYLVASAYGMLANGQPVPREVVVALQQTFTPVRGAWGGLGLAAYGYERLGDTATAQQLLAEERARVGVATLVPVLPHLAAWAQQRGQALA